MAAALDRRTLADILFLGLLAVYVFLGMPGVPFHGDEGMQLAAARDYFTLFVERDPAGLATQPPYGVDTAPHLRILNGSVNRYAIGLAWHISGRGMADLPVIPGWWWERSYDDNTALGFRPADAALATARLPATAFHAASVIALFLLARRVFGRPAAYVAALLYTLHPALLLNGRRALQESAMIFFGLLALWSAAQLTSRHERSPRQPGLTLAGLALTCGLTLLSKHSGIVFVAASFLWVIAGEWHMHQLTWRRAAQLAAVGVAVVGLFVAGSPAFWRSPVMRFGDLLAVRSELLQSQVTAAGGSIPITARLGTLAAAPFLQPPQYFEAPTFDVPPIHAAVGAYEASWLAGMRWGLAGGVILSALACLGTAALAFKRSGVSSAHALGLLLTLGVMSANVVVTPLPWQRYALPYITIVVLLAAYGAQILTRALGISQEDRGR